MVGDPVLDFLKNLLASGRRLTKRNFVYSFISLGISMLNSRLLLLGQLKKLTDCDDVLHETFDWGLFVIRHLLDKLEEVVFTDESFLLRVNQQEK